MTPRHLLAALFTGLALAAPLSAQQIVNLPLGSWANDITPDGEIVVGTWNYNEGFIWRWRVDPAPTVIHGGDAVAVSDDGSVVCGNFPGSTGVGEAAIWTAATGWQGLGWLPGTSTTCGGGMSAAYDISGDGTIVVGLAWGTTCSGRGFRWTAATGMQPMQSLANGHNRCSAISGNGQVMGGFAQGTFNRTPAYWSPDLSGYVLDPAFQGEVNGFNEDGSKSVGTRWFSGGTFDAFLRDATTGVFTKIGKLQSTWAGQATDLSEDAQVIVGFDHYSLSRKAWVWTAGQGIVSLKDRLVALGVGGVPNLLVCRAVSDDGNVVVGGAEAGGGGPFGIAGFIAEFETGQAQWTDLGSGLAGTSGVPELDGSGALTAGSSTSIVLNNGKPSAPAAFVVGLSAIYAPFKQGVLVPFPDLLVVVPALSPHGSVGLQFAWPAGLPSGFSSFWQVIVADPLAPAGYALSNALQGTTP